MLLSLSLAELFIPSVYELVLNCLGKRIVFRGLLGLSVESVVIGVSHSLEVGSCRLFDSFGLLLLEKVVLVRVYLSDLSLGDNLSVLARFLRFL